MVCTRILAGGVAAVALLATAPPAHAGSFVRLGTSMGRIDLILGDSTPVTNQNFRGYVARGDYDGTFVHRRAVAPDIIQGGGFGFDGDYFEVPAQPPIPNESLLDNVRGTIAMARLTAPDSAMSQWFINVGDNVGLSNFAVFGRVAPDSMAVVDAIAALPVVSGNVTVDTPFNANFAVLPLLAPLPPFTAACAVFSPPLPPFFQLNVQDDCPDADAFAAAVQARMDAVGPRVPERLVFVNQAVQLPSSYGKLKIVTDLPTTFLEERVHEVFTGEGDETVEQTLRRRRLGRKLVRDAEWAVETNEIAWRALTREGSRIGGPLEPRGSRGRRFALELDAASQETLLAEVAAELERRLVERALLLHLFGRESIDDGLPDPMGDEEDPEIPPRASVSLELVGEPTIRAKLKRSGRLRIKGRLQVQGTAATRIHYNVDGPVRDFESFLVRAVSGVVRFKVKGHTVRLLEPAS